MSDDPPDYRVGYKRPPRDTRFKKGRSGNPEGGRRHRRRDRGLVALIEEALDARVAAPSRRKPTWRQAIITGLVEKSAAGDLRATKLLLDLVLKTELAAPPPDPDEEDPRIFLLRELDRLAAGPSPAADGGTKQGAPGDNEAAPRG